jgi:preprotein translocase SecF subunit
VLNSDEYQITVPSGEDLTPEEIRESVSAALVAQFGDNASVVASSSVDSAVGDEFKVTAFFTVLVASLVILGYIAIRFKPIFGAAAVIALVHDLLITLGIFVVLGRSVTLEIVSALLIVLGYSVNDTIVTFDRIREIMANSYGRPMRDIINEGINKTLARTVFTSGTTLIAVLSMLFFGGVGLKDFALILLIGILAGTYSSVFIASAIIDSYMLHKEKKVGAAKAHGQVKTVRVGAQ